MNRLVVASVATFTLLTGALVAAPAAAAPLSSIQGQVLTLDSGGNVVTPGTDEVYVRILEAGGTEGTGFQYAGYTLADGTFDIGVPVGNYQVHFEMAIGSPLAGVESLWYGGALYQSEAQVITVGSSAATGIDITLGWGSTLSGTIHPAAGSSTPPDWAVNAYPVDSNGIIGYQYGGHIESDGDYTIVGLAPGNYLLRYFPIDYYDPGFDEQLWEDAQGLYQAELVAVPADTDLTGYDVQLTDDGPLYVARAAGADRIATSIAVSQGLYDDGAASVVYLANGYNYPDALSAGPAAAIGGGPLLLTAPGSIRSDLIAEIDRLDPDEIVIVGGPAAVSAAGEQQLVSRYGAGAVVRLGGATRYETSILIAQHAFPFGASTAFIATGTNFPDALAAGPAAAYRGGPVVLVPGSSASIGSATSALLTDLGVHTAFIAGGESSVSAAIEAQVRSIPGMLTVQRFGGANRYETAKLINRLIFRYADTGFLAAGTGFADALAGSAAAGASRSPIYLTPHDCLASGIYEDWRANGGTLMVTLGGEAALSESAYLLIDC